MNEQKTPRFKSISASESASGSVPNISTLSENEFININMRKRKEHSDQEEYRKDFANFRDEIMGFLRDFGRTQTENLTTIRDDITDIKSEMKKIKLATEKFTKQFENVNTEIKEIKTQNIETQQKIEDIETEISKLKNAEILSLGPQVVTNTSEVLIQELRERYERQKNVIIEGILEKNESDVKKRRANDIEEAMKVITSIHANCPKPLRALRLGKYIPNKNRPLKICFNETDSPKIVLQNRASLPTHIKIYADQTPAQKVHWQSIKEQLKQRTDNGEAGLTIKYIRGAPKIITMKPKN